MMPVMLTNQQHAIIAQGVGSFPKLITPVTLISALVVLS